MEADVLIYDIETKTFGRPDPTKDELKFFGCYSYKTKKSYLLTSIEDIQKIIDNHRILVGFNNSGNMDDPGYDNPILERAGVNLQYKVFVDLMQVFKKRAGSMKIKKGMLGDLLMSYSLDYITKMLDLVDDEDGKMKFDYSLFNKNTWTTEELQLIEDYTLRDIDITRKLYEWVEKYFESFKEFVNEKDIKGKKYLTCGTAPFAYKAICKKLGMKEEYSNDQRKVSFGGGYVAYPSGEDFHSSDGGIFYYDYSSLYPSTIIQNNLENKRCECCSDDELWKGNDVFKIEGAYCTKQLTSRNKLLKNWYMFRKELKKQKDPREYSVKIILNSTYGAMTNPSFKNIYDLVAGSDCTLLGRQIIKYTRKRFKENEYKNLMSDTDSVCVQAMNGQTKEEADKLAEQIVQEVISNFPFPWREFTLELENEIKHAYFFKGQGVQDKESDSEMDEDDVISKPLDLMKKNYIMVTKDGDIIIKNLGIKKKSNSTLSRKIFWEYLVPKIKEGQCKFSKMYIKKLINDLLTEDIELACMRKNVGPASSYKLDSSIQAQIATKYGAGIHFLIPNLKHIGVGKGKSMCTIEEFRSKGLKIDDINLDNIWKELGYFIKPVVRSLFEF